MWNSCGTTNPALCSPQKLFPKQEGWRALDLHKSPQKRALGLREMRKLRLQRKKLQKLLWTGEKKKTQKYLNGRKKNK